MRPRNHHRDVIAWQLHRHCHAQMSPQRSATVTPRVRCFICHVAVAITDSMHCEVRSLRFTTTLPQRRKRELVDINHRGKSHTRLSSFKSRPVFLPNLFPVKICADPLVADSQVHPATATGATVLIAFEWPLQATNRCW